MDPLSPSVVLAAYAESLLEGRRIVVFGDATSDLPQELLERGARVVHVFDPEPARAAEAAGRNRSKQLSIVPLDDADVAVRDGAFDVAIVDDLSTVREPAPLLKRLRRALTAKGTAIVASPNAEARFVLVPRTSAVRRATPLGYYELYDAISAEFPEVRMLGQTPFVGYAVVDFAPQGEPEVSIDSGLVPGGAEEPEWFIAVASREPAELDAFGVVQLPASRVVGAGADAKLAEELRGARGAEARLGERAAALEVELSALRVALEAPRKDAAADEVASLTKELARREARLTELEALAVAADARADDALERLESEKMELGRRLSAATSDASAGATEKGELGNQLASTAKQLATVRDEKAELTDRLAAATGQLAGFSAEKELLERARQELAQVLAAVTKERDTLTKGLTRERDALTKERDTLTRERDALTKERDTLTRERDTLTKERDALSTEVATHGAELRKLTEVVPADASDDVARLEDALRDRGERIRKLEADLREAERTGRELVRELGGRAEPVPAASTTEAPLAKDNARLRADLEAASWTIDELEGRLSRVAASPAEAR